MNSNQKIEWFALEYEEKERSADWFWALGVIVVAGSVASIIFGDYFFAILLLLGGISLGFFAVKKPNMISYELGEKGLKIRGELYPYENIKSFWVQANSDTETDLPAQTEKKPTLFIKSGRFMMPIISMPIDVTQAEKIRSLM